VIGGSIQTAPDSVDENLYVRLETEIHRLLVGLLGSRGPILEIGCGDCSHADQLAEATGAEVVGIDINADILPRRGRRQVGADCIRADAELVSQTGTDRFGSAVARFVVHELRHPKIVLRELFKVVKPGGVVALADPVRGSIAERLYEEDYYTPGQLAGFLRWAGFSDVDCRLLGNGNLAFVVGRKK
jgi:ubiquinone/menaquinone biosynthesis C-methylase UbiE